MSLKGADEIVHNALLLRLEINRALVDSKDLMENPGMVDLDLEDVIETGLLSNHEML